MITVRINDYKPREKRAFISMIKSMQSALSKKCNGDETPCVKCDYNHLCRDLNKLTIYLDDLTEKESENR